MSIKEKAMIMNFSCGIWTAKKLDKKVTDALCRQNNTTKDWTRVNKSLIENEAIKEIQQIQTEARNWFNLYTLPWGDNADRLVSSDIYFTIIEKMKGYEDTFFQKVQSLFDKYNELKSRAKVQLNGFFNEKDYPSLSELERKFYFKVSVFPIPTSDDFRVSLSDDEVKKIKQNIDDAYSSRLKESINNIYKRVFEALSHIVERLSDKESTFRNSLIENVKELCDILPQLNITNDKNIEELFDEIKSTICKKDPDTLRTNKKERRNTKEKAEELINKMKGFYNG